MENRIVVAFFLVFISLTGGSMCQDLTLVEGETYVYMASNTTCDLYSGCGLPGPDLTPPDEVCVVEGTSFPVDCDCVNETVVATAVPLDNCKNCLSGSKNRRINYTSVREALENCPYDPAVIEVTGTHYVGSLAFPSKSAVVIRGYMSEVALKSCSIVSPDLGNNTDFLKAINITDSPSSFKYLINVTYARVPISYPAKTVLVGNNHTVLNENTTIAFANVTLEGCNTGLPLFALCGWERLEPGSIDPNTTAICEDMETQPLPDTNVEEIVEPLSCKVKKKGTYVPECYSEMGFNLTCHMIIEKAGPCVIDGVLTPMCAPKRTHQWNCTRADDLTGSDSGSDSGSGDPPEGSGNLDPDFVCLFNEEENLFYDCLVLITPGVPAAEESTDCPNCDEAKPPVYERYAVCRNDTSGEHVKSCAGCLNNNDMVLVNSTVRNFRGTYVIRMYSTEDFTELTVIDSDFVDIPGYAIHAQGVDGAILHGNLFERCGGMAGADCVFIKPGFAAKGGFELIDNIHYYAYNTLDYPCNYYLNGEVKCQDGYLQCVDFVNTTLNDCRAYNMTSIPGGALVYDENCAVFAPCQCGNENLTVVFNQTIGNYSSTDLSADGALVQVQFDLSGLGVPYQQGNTYFYPCVATNSTPGDNQTSFGGLGNSTLLNVTRCPVNNGTVTNTSNTECHEAQTCECPKGALDRANKNCNTKDVNKIVCQGGVSYCNNKILGFTNYTLSGGLISAIILKNDSASNNGTKVKNSNGLTCRTENVRTSCGCPVLNVTRSKVDGSVVDVVEMPDGTNVGVKGSDNTTTWETTDNYPFSVNGVNYTCVSGDRVECSCADNSYNATSGDPPPSLCYEVGDCSAAFHFGHIPDTVATFKVWNNVAEGLSVGLTIDTVSYDVVVNGSYLLPSFKHDRGILYELARLNPNITGTVNDTVLGGCPWYWTGLSCNDGCPMSLPKEWDEACSVDWRYSVDTPGFGFRRFSKIQTAINECDLDTVVVHLSNNVYEEQIVLNRTNFMLLSYNQAVIVASNITIAASNVTVRGFVLFHPRTNELPIMRPNSAPKEEFGELGDIVNNALGLDPPANCSILNNVFIGNNVMKAGVLVGEMGRNFTFKYNTIYDFFTRALDVLAPGPSDISYNEFHGVLGRSIRVRNAWEYCVNLNNLINCRGLAEGKGVDIISLETVDGIDATGTPDYKKNSNGEPGGSFETIDPTSLSTVGIGCTYKTNNTQKPCWCSGNKIVTDDDLRDLSDVGIRIRGGGLEKEYTSDNVVTHAQYGIYFMWTRDITYDQRAKIYKRNSLIRVADVQRTIFGYDIYFRPLGSIVDIGCSFPDCRDESDDKPKYEVNSNYKWLYTPFYGYNVFHNLTDAGRYTYMKWKSVSKFKYFVNVTQWGGARINIESPLVVDRPVAYRGCDWPCGLPPSFTMSGSTISSWYFNVSGLQFRYGEYGDSAGIPMWSTESGAAVYHVIFNDTSFVGMMQEDAGRITIAKLTIQANNGTFYMTRCSAYEWYHLPEDTYRPSEPIQYEGRQIYAVYLPDGSVKRADLAAGTNGFYITFGQSQQKVERREHVEVAEKGRKSHKKKAGRASDDEKYSHGYAYGEEDAYDMYLAEQQAAAGGSSSGDGSESDSGFVEGEIEYNPDGTVSYYKVVNGKKVRYKEPRGMVVITNNYFSDLDGTTLNIQGAWSANVSNNTYINSGGRMEGEGAAVFVGGTFESHGIFDVSLNLFEQHRPAIMPQSGGIKNNPGSFSLNSAISVKGLCNCTVFRFRNNTIKLYRRPPTVTVQANRTRTITYTALGAVDSSEVSGYSYGARFSGMCNRTYYLNVMDNQVIYFNNWRPLEARLREPIASYNTDVHGIFCDFIICDPYSDIFYATKSFKSQCTCCTNGCLPPIPDVCLVDRDNKTFVKGNPYYGTYYFTTLNDAVMKCMAVSKTIQVVGQKKGPYVETIKLYGPGGFNITTLNDAVFKGSGFEINAPGFNFDSLVFKHQGGQPTILTNYDMLHPGRYLPNVTFTNVTFDGKGTKQRALKGRFHNVTYTGCNFSGYDGDYGVTFKSDCGDLTVLKSDFTGFPGSALNATGLGSYEFSKNVILDSGARSNEAECVICLGMCRDKDNGTVIGAGPVVVKKNRMISGESHGSKLYKKGGHKLTDEKVDGGHVSSFLFDGLPYTGDFNIAENQVTGLPIGFRFTEPPPTNLDRYEIFGRRPQKGIQMIFYKANTNVKGTWNDIVVGDKKFDKDIDDDPQKNAGRHCKDGCNYGDNTAFVAFVLYPLIFAIFFCCVYSKFTQEHEIRMITDMATGLTVPEDRSLWPRVAQEQTFFTDTTVPINPQRMPTSEEVAQERLNRERDLAAKNAEDAAILSSFLQEDFRNGRKEKK